MNDSGVQTRHMAPEWQQFYQAVREAMQRDRTGIRRVKTNVDINVETEETVDNQEKS